MRRRLAVSFLVLLLAAPTAWLKPPITEKPVPVDTKTRTDRNGDPLPTHALDRLGTLQLWHESCCVAFSPDGKTLVSGGRDGIIRLWDRASGKETRCYDGAKHGVHCLAFSSDGKTLAYGGGASHLTDSGLLDLQSGKVIHHMFNGIWPVHSLLFTPDGKSLIAGAYESIGVWDTATGKMREWLEIPGLDKKGYSIDALTLTSDGNTLALATGFGKTLTLWDRTAKKELRSWEAKGGQKIAFSPDSKTLVSDGSGGCLRLWDTSTGKELAEFKGHADQIWAVTFSPDGKLLASTGNDGTIRLWDSATGKETHCFGQHYGGICALAFSPDGKTLASAGSKITLWDVASQKDLIPSTGHKDGVSSLALSPDGETLASTGFDGTIRIWDLAAGKERRRIVANVRDYWSGRCTYSPDGKILAWCDDKTLCLADAATGKDQRRFDAKAKIWRIAFSPNGKLLAMGIDGHGIDLCDPLDGKLIRTIDTAKHAVLDLAFSPDGNILTAAAQPGENEEPTAFLWEAATGKQLTRLTGHTNRIRLVAFAPDGNQLLTNGEDHTVRLWDVWTGKEVRKLQGLKDTVSDAAFSPDGNTIAGAVRDGSVRLWETATGKERCRFEGHRSWAESVVFSPDGRRLISGSSDTTCLVWDVTGLKSANEPPPVELSDVEWAALWDALAGEDAVKAHRAIWTMVSSKQTAERLSARLRPVAAPERGKVEELLRQLEGEEFDARQKAQRELETLADVAEPSLHRALANKPSLELRRHIEEILERTKEPSPERLRTWRAAEVLGQIDSTEARRLLQSLATGAPDARLTRQAIAVLKRLEARDNKP
jgi:WD40 repeat protein